MGFLLCPYCCALETPAWVRPQLPGQGSSLPQYLLGFPVTAPAWEGAHPLLFPSHLLLVSCLWISEQLHFNRFSKLIALPFSCKFCLGWREVDGASHYSPAILESFQAFLSGNASITWNPIFYQRCTFFPLFSSFPNTERERGWDCDGKRGSMHKPSVLTVWASVCSQQCWHCVSAPLEFSRYMGHCMVPRRPGDTATSCYQGRLQAPGTQGTDGSTGDSSLSCGPWESSIHMVPLLHEITCRDWACLHHYSAVFAPSRWPSWTQWFVGISFFALFALNKMTSHLAVWWWNHSCTLIVFVVYMESHVVNFVENVTEWQCNYTTANPSALGISGETERGLEVGWEWPINRGHTSLPSRRAAQEQNPCVLGSTHVSESWKGKDGPAFGYTLNLYVEVSVLCHTHTCTHTYHSQFTHMAV